MNDLASFYVFVIQRSLIRFVANQLANSRKMAEIYQKLFQLVLRSFDLKYRFPLAFSARFVSHEIISDLINLCFVSSVDEFFASGLSLWSDLINAGCYAASVIILSRLVPSFASSVTMLTTKQAYVTLCLSALYRKSSSQSLFDSNKCS